MDVATLRAEIKTWEREFREKHGRDPTVHEIKDRPDVAAKYKLYKQLSRRRDQPEAASTSAKPAAVDRPRTPPTSNTRARPRVAASSVLSVSKQRAVRTEAPLITSNPFSPVKHKRRAANKHDISADSPPSPVALLLPSSTRHQTNPFATPSKPRQRPSIRKIPSPTLEEDPFPLIDALSDASSPKAPLAAHPDTRSGLPNARAGSNAMGDRADDAVARARKRLRGEHVSPSPVKEKRARTAFERVPSFALERGSLFGALQAAKDADSDEEPVVRGLDHLTEDFVAQTPAKRAKSGRTFVKLFDEANHAPPFASTRPANTSARKAPSRNKSAESGRPAHDFPSHDMSRENSSQPATSPPLSDSEDEMEVDSGSSGGKLSALDFADDSTRTGQLKGPGRPLSLARAVRPSKSNLYDNAGNAKNAQVRNVTVTTKKPPLSLSGAGQGADGAEPQRSHPSSSSLLPPSPPPASAGGSRYTGDKGTASAKGLARKKTKLLDQLGPGGELSDGDDGDDAVKIVEVPWSWQEHLRTKRQNDASADESEPEFTTTAYRPAPTPHSPTALEEHGELEVALPEHLRQVLALSPRGSAPNQYGEDEEKLARGLIYGRLEGHYDSARGGEIWGVGEVSEGEASVEERIAHHREEDEDWEGEPVPWEAGEL